MRPRLGLRKKETGCDSPPQRDYPHIRSRPTRENDASIDARRSLRAKRGLPEARVRIVQARQGQPAGRKSRRDLHHWGPGAGNLHKRKEERDRIRPRLGSFKTDYASVPNVPESDFWVANECDCDGCLLNLDALARRHAVGVHLTAFGN
jgi:hypothetical protein